MRIRDQRYDSHGYIFSGFPKNHDISKAIDREAGAVREVVGEKITGNAKKTQVDRAILLMVCTVALKINVTKPATQDAQKWAGFGTALKPAQEPAVLARKPIQKGLTIAQNVLKYGVGAINIDDCRFGYGDPCWVGDTDEIRDPRASNGLTAPNGSSIFGLQNHKNDNYAHYRGRWPANIYQCPKPFPS